MHFLLLGALLFGAYGWLNRGALEAPDEIVVDAGRVASLSAQFERVWRRPPTPQELDGLIQTFVREEIFYREGLAMGLDRDDPVVRRRIGQKMAFLAEGLTPQAPSEGELQAWLDAHATDYAIEPRYSLRQVFFDPARRGDALEADLVKARAALQGEAAAVGTDRLGDATLLPAALRRARASEIESVFGRDFAQALAQLTTGVWQGPVRSGYGVHLVMVEAREEAYTPTLDAVRAHVERDLLRARTEQASEAFYRELRERYTVRIEASAADGAPARIAAMVQ
ncbi:MAG: peptidyl-prolyl cis-trans isomerase [Burkholderiales bacterium]